MVFRHDNYRNYLSEVLVFRSEQNPAYSLRLFAMELGISPSGLSEILKGKKNLSYGKAVEICHRLELPADETAYFCALTQLASARRPEEKKQILQRINEIHPKNKMVDLSLDLFSAISEWYHVPILALTDVPSFSLTDKNVAKKLGITRVQAEVAIERLVRLELLERLSHTKYRRVQNHIMFKSKDINKALQNFHRQMLGKAADALATQANTEKVVETRTFAFDPTQLEEAKRRISRFLSELMDFLETGEKKTEVYHLSLHIFNIKGEKK
jgi:uncharacterized protein (TIGR02147 family)